MLVNEENIMLEACIQVRLESKLDNNGIVMAIYVGVDPIQSLEDLAD